MDTTPYYKKYISSMVDLILMSDYITSPYMYRDRLDT